MKAQTKERVTTIVWPVLYFALAIDLAVAISVVSTRTAYERIFVSGHSMDPTLNGGDGHVGDTVDFGYTDPSLQAKRNIKRFNIVTTYFPYGWSNADYDSEGKLNPGASYKIKRIIGLPGEKINLYVDDSCHINIVKGKDSFTYTYDEDKNGWWCSNDADKKQEERHLYKYKINHSGVTSSTPSKNFSTVLGDNEYFVMGDNWYNSSDSSTNTCSGFNHHITFDNLQGVLIAIEGKGTIVYDETARKNTINNLQYETPRYYYTEL